MNCTFKIRNHHKPYSHLNKFDRHHNKSELTDLAGHCKGKINTHIFLPMIFYLKFFEYDTLVQVSFGRKDKYKNMVNKYRYEHTIRALYGREMNTKKEMTNTLVTQERMTYKQKYTQLFSGRIKKNPSVKPEVNMLKWK